MIFKDQLNSLTDDELTIVYESVRPVAEKMNSEVGICFISTFKLNKFRELIQSKKPFIREEHQHLIDSILNKIC